MWLSYFLAGIVESINGIITIFIIASPKSISGNARGKKSVPSVNSNASVIDSTKLLQMLNNRFL